MSRPEATPERWHVLDEAPSSARRFSTGPYPAVVHWGRAQEIFHTTDLSPADWAVGAAVASSVLLLEEARKLFSGLTGPG